MKVENNFSDILTERAILYPKKVFCHKINGREITFLELEQNVNQCCRFYEEIGIVSGDVLTISIPNSISFIIFYIAGIRTGIKVNPCPATLSDHELIKNVNFVESKLLITHMCIDEDRLPASGRFCYLPAGDGRPAGFPKLAARNFGFRRRGSFLSNRWHRSLKHVDHHAP